MHEYAPYYHESRKEGQVAEAGCNSPAEHAAEHHEDAAAYAEHGQNETLYETEILVRPEARSIDRPRARPRRRSSRLRAVRSRLRPLYSSWRFARFREAFSEIGRAHV